jgi:hypothetical protein
MAEQVFVLCRPVNGAPWVVDEPAILEVFLEVPVTRAQRPRSTYPRQGNDVFIIGADAHDAHDTNLCGHRLVCDKVQAAGFAERCHGSEGSIHPGQLVAVEAAGHKDACLVVRQQPPQEGTEVLIG